MCIIYACHEKPMENILKNGFEQNPDGAGIAYVEEGTLKIHKGVVKSLRSILELIEAHDPPYLIHFRWRSAGEVSAQMAHPFYVTPTIALAHNGHLHTVPYTQRESDTYKLVKALQKIPFTDLDQLVPILTLMGGGKYALMDNRGTIRLVGHFEKVTKGIYASNSGWRGIPLRISYKDWRKDWYEMGTTVRNWERDWD